MLHPHPPLARAGSTPGTATNMGQSQQGEVVVRVGILTLPKEYALPNTLGSLAFEPVHKNLAPSAILRCAAALRIPGVHTPRRAAPTATRCPPPCPPCPIHCSPHPPRSVLPSWLTHPAPVAAELSAPPPAKKAKRQGQPASAGVDLLAAAAAAADPCGGSDTGAGISPVLLPRRQQRHSREPTPAAVDASYPAHSGSLYSPSGAQCCVGALCSRVITAMAAGHKVRVPAGQGRAGQGRGCTASLAAGTPPALARTAAARPTRPTHPPQARKGGSKGGAKVRFGQPAGQGGAGQGRAGAVQLQWQRAPLPAPARTAAARRAHLHPQTIAAGAQGWGRAAHRPTACWRRAATHSTDHAGGVQGGGQGGIRPAARARSHHHCRHQGQGGGPASPRGAAGRLARGARCKGGAAWGGCFCGRALR